MNQHIVLPIAIFLCATYAFRTILDIGFRYWLLRSREPVDRLRVILQAAQEQRRLSALRWGIVLIVLGVGFAVVQAIGSGEVSPGTIAVLVIATGVGNLIYFGISRRFY